MRKICSLLLISAIVFTTILVQAGGSEVNSYVIKPNDQIKTMVYGNPELNIATVVPPDGMISFPLIGEVNVLNKTPEQLSIILEEKLTRYLTEPDVSVIISPMQPLKVYVLGSVNKSGAVDYKPGNRLTDYIADAGGFSREADIEKCFIYPVNDSIKAQTISLKEILEEGKTSLNVELRPFDTVYLQQKPGFTFSNWQEVGEFVRIITGIIAVYLWIDRI